MINGNAARDNKNISSWLTTCWRHRCTVVKYRKKFFYEFCVLLYTHIHLDVYNNGKKDSLEPGVSFSPPFRSETENNCLSIMLMKCFPIDRPFVCFVGSIIKYKCNAIGLSFIDFQVTQHTNRYNY